MRPRRPGGEAVLEAGIVASLGLVLAALGIVGIGRAAGVRQRARRDRKRRPEPGSIPATRHQQIAVASAR